MLTILHQCCDDQCLGHATILQWYAKFLEDLQQSTSRTTLWMKGFVQTPTNCNTIAASFEPISIMLVHCLEPLVHILRSSIHRIPKEVLGMRCVCSPWVHICWLVNSSKNVSKYARRMNSLRNRIQCISLESSHVMKFTISSQNVAGKHHVEVALISKKEKSEAAYFD